VVGFLKKILFCPGHAVQQTDSIKSRDLFNQTWSKQLAIFFGQENGLFSSENFETIFKILIFHSEDFMSKLDTVMLENKVSFIMPKKILNSKIYALF